MEPSSVDRINNTNSFQKVSLKNFIIQMATKDDIEGIIKLHSYLINMHADVLPSLFRKIFLENPRAHQAEIDLYNNLFNKPNFHMFIAKKINSNEIIGYADISIREEINNITGKNQKFCYIEDICVDKDYQNQGIGKELIETINIFAKNNGCIRVELNVDEFNKNAREFYKHLGFNPTRTVMELNIS